jgi:hypothetical protein
MCALGPGVQRVVFVGQFHYSISLKTAMVQSAISLNDCVQSVGVGDL